MLRLALLELEDFERIFRSVDVRVGIELDDGAVFKALPGVDVVEFLAVAGEE